MKSIRLIQSAAFIAVTMAFTAQAGECPAMKCDSACAHKGRTVSYFTIGGIGIEVADVNAATHATEAQRARDGAARVGLGSYHSFGRFNVDLGIDGTTWMRRNADDDSVQARLSAATGHIRAGFDFVKSDNVALFPYAGYDGGMVMLNIIHTPQSFDDVTAGESPRETKIRQRTTGVDAGLGFDYVFHPDRKRSLSLGVRAGYIWDFSEKADWSTGRMVDVAGGPDISYTGPYASLVVGKSFAPMAKKRGCDHSACTH